MKCALSIAGSDPTGGAGLQADLQVFSAFGVHGAGVITALTLQDSAKVHSVMPVFPSVALDQIRVLLADITPSAVKIGMLASDDVARMVQLGLAKLGADIPRVIDPVLAASDGTPLLERRAWPVLREIMHGAELVTPNLPEAELLSETVISRAQDCERAARIFVEDFGCRSVLIKGGHRDGAPDDLLAIGGESGLSMNWLRAERLDVGAVHGTGCALASGITAGLALGYPLEKAVEEARKFVARGLLNAAPLGNGARFLGTEGTQ